MELTSSHKKIVNSIATSCLSVRLRLMNRIVGGIFDEALRPHGIKASQLTILVTLSAFARATSKELCRALHMDTSTFSRALAILKKNRWLHVEPSGEGKILKIEVTAEGLKKIEEVYPDWQRAQKQAIDVLGESTSETIISSGTQHLLGGMTI
jgi:DNA-binding MarR family transcriptional regulator